MKVKVICSNAYLNDEEKDILMGMGYLKEDLAQIEWVEKSLSCKVFNEDGTSEKINHYQARQIMERKEYLSGLGRASFHRTAMRNTKDGRQILFDASRFFKHENYNRIWGSA